MNEFQKKLNLEESIILANIKKEEPKEIITENIYINLNTPIDRINNINY